jgi:hypothetical protein
MHAEKLPEVLADLSITVTYIRDEITEEAESFDFDEAIALRDACLAVKAEAETAISLIDTTLLGHLEAGAQQRGTRLYKRKRNVVERFRHDLIRAAVATWARKEACDDNGEVSASKAVDNAVQAMVWLYVSPSTKAKIGALDGLGIERKTVSESEDKGWKLEIEQLDARTD